MTDEVLRRFLGALGEGASHSHRPPAAAGCLTFPRAERIARDRSAAGETEQAHLAVCPRCRCLVRAFEQELAGQPPEATHEP